MSSTSAAPLISSGPTPASLAVGTELLGEYQGSGRRQTTFIVRRPDGRMFELSELVYVVACNLDGTRPPREIAERVSTRLVRPITPDGVTYLIEQKLRPLHLLAADDDGDGVIGTPTKGPPSLLALQIQPGIVPARAVDTISRAFAPLFVPPLVGAVVAAIVGLDVWLLAARGPSVSLGVRTATTSLLFHPGQILVIIGLVVVAGAFHEFGHAAACRYGGARPGRIGVGIYLFWPVFYNDLTDSYRLNRSGRLRADLGGIYFSVLATSVYLTLFLVTGYPPLLIASLLQHLVILQQLLPFVRLDGYYIVSDLAGEPDLFGRLRSYLPLQERNRQRQSTGAELTLRSRVIVAVWMATTVPLLVAALVLVACTLPNLVRTGRLALALDLRSLAASFQTSSTSRAAVSGIQLLLFLVPVVGVAVPLTRATAQLLRRCESSRSGTLGLCLSLAVTSVAIIAGAVALIVRRHL